MKNSKNPLSGMAFFNKKGALLLSKGIKFGGELNPKIKPREWFYLLFEACKEKNIKTCAGSKLLEKNYGSRTTQWRTKKSLIKKGYL